MTPDRDLVRAAQTGDALALGMLLERHRAALQAHALQLVGHAEAPDAVQDTFVTAMRRIGSVRDPERVEGWLHIVLRNACLDRLRARVPLTDTPEVAAPAADEPESVIDSLALRDWVWTAIGRLSEPLRLVTMLRHFSSCNAYRDIAIVCDIPVGTVRSRLNEARRLLADDLLRTTATSHTEAERLRATEHERMSESFTALSEAGDPEPLISCLEPDVVYRFTDGTRVTGHGRLRASLAADVEAGVELHVRDVVASPGLTVFRGDFVNPVSDPFHCPPSVTQVHRHRDGVSYHVTMYYEPRPERAVPPGQPDPDTLLVVDRLLRVTNA